MSRLHRSLLLRPPLLRYHLCASFAVVALASASLSGCSLLNPDPVDPPDTGTAPPPKDTADTATKVDVVDASGPDIQFEIDIPKVDTVKPPDTKGDADSVTSPDVDVDVVGADAADGDPGDAVADPDGDVTAAETQEGDVPDEADGDSGIGSDSDDAADTEDGGAPDTSGPPVSCFPGEKLCVGDHWALCNAIGDGYAEGPTLCANGEHCGGSGNCIASLCTPNGKWCEGNEIIACAGNGGTVGKFESCAEGKACVENTYLIQAECKTIFCTPGEKGCLALSGKSQAVTCNATGTDFDGIVDCTAKDMACAFGTCVGAVCGDGVMNQVTEECDAGSNNGNPIFGCDPQCKKLVAAGCKVDSDCAALQLGKCQASFQCVVGACVPVVKVSGPCDDDNLCTVSDKCVLGKCKGVPDACDDGTACTEDTCAPKTGCAHKALAKTPCDDGNPCTVQDYCQSSKCVSGVNACACSTDADCAPYDDNNACNGKLACVGGGTNKHCHVEDNSEVFCDASGDAACQKTACDPTTGECAAGLKINGSPCNDDNNCTIFDQCWNGGCIGDSVNCDDDSVCSLDSCDPVQGCTHVPASAADQVPCDDGDLCTFGDKCSFGKCQGEVSAAGCDDGNPCTSEDVCADGICAGKASCECTGDADCAGKAVPTGMCSASWACIDNHCAVAEGSAVICSGAAGSPCLANACVDGKCELQPIAGSDGAPCEDSNGCTKDDVCDEGACVGLKIVCNDSNSCTDDVCDPDLGCVFVTNTAPCSDSEPCTKDDTCFQGVCNSGVYQCDCSTNEDCAKYDIEDPCAGSHKCVSASGVKKCFFDPDTVGYNACDGSKNTACFVNACVVDPTKGPTAWKCSVLKPVVPCVDGNPCTINDTCGGGACKGVTNPCDDKNPCSKDACDPELLPFGCSHNVASMEGLACDDGDPCTKEDLCASGGCVGALVDAVKDCDDGNTCTTEFCSPYSGGCGNAPVQLPIPCEDGDKCTAPDACDGKGGCTSGGPKACDEGGACYEYSCEPATGCKKDSLPMNGKECPYGDKCFEANKCQSGTCSAGSKKSCDDQNACTKDSCEPVSGCKYIDEVGPCDDGEVCTDQDECIVGVCKGAAIDCDDVNICTADACEAGVGCVYSKAAGSCGSYASCNDEPVPFCVFQGSQHLVFSELYVGVPCDPSDDFIELHNPSPQQPDLGDYVVMARPAASEDKADWQVIATLPAGTNMKPYGYFLIGAAAKVIGGKSVDLVSPELALSPTGMQLRIFDVPHTLQHDHVAWGAGAAVPSGAPAAPWPSQNSLERRAGANADATTMAIWQSQWLAGNGWDTDDSSKDFVVRVAPEPQSLNAGWYEPACAGTCGFAKACDLAGPGADSCAIDTLCHAGCAAGEVCSAIAGQCLPDSKGHVVLSELFPGTAAEPNSQFVEVHNPSSDPVDLAGVQLRLKGFTALPNDPWPQTVVQFPAGMTLEPGRYATICSADWAKTHGGCDLVVDGVGLQALGGAVQLWDPRVGAELDMVGWGSAKTSSGTTAATPPPGKALQRKATASSDATTLAPAGSEYLLGNGRDSNADSSDWILMAAPEPQSYMSQVYEPACNGTCPLGKACNFAPKGAKCVLTDCGGICKTGEVCSLLTETCSDTILISQVRIHADDGQGGALIKEEFVELYNPGAHAVDLTGTSDDTGKPMSMLLQLKKGNQSWQSQMPFFPPGTSIPAHGFLLVVNAASSLQLKAQADFVGYTWDAEYDDAWRLVRSDAQKFPSGKLQADQVAWRYANSSEPNFNAEGNKGAPSPTPAEEGKKPDSGTMIRKDSPWQCGVNIDDPLAGDYYAGHSWDTNVNADDWLLTSSPHPRNSTHPPQKP